MKNKELSLLMELLREVDFKPYLGGRGIRVVGADKQKHYYLLKWVKKDWWDYGTTVRSGWFTPKGIKYFIDLLERRDNYPW